MSDQSDKARLLREEEETAKRRNQEQINREKFELLDGTRKGSEDAMRKAAVRIDNLDGLVKIPQTLQAPNSLSAAPTADDYNKLRADIEAIHRALADVSNALSKRLVP